MIVGPCRVVTGGPEPQVIEDAGVRVVGSHIAQVGRIGPLAASYREETLWPGRGRLLLPGFVNAHAHLARALGRGQGFATRAEWDRFDRALAPEDVHWATLAALVEGVRHGVTTTCDLHRSARCLDLSLSEVTSAAAKLGVRVATAYAASEEDPPVERRAALAECTGLAADLARRRHGGLRALLGLRASTPAGLAELLAEAEERTCGSLALHLELDLDATPAQRWRGPSAPERPSLWAHAERAPRELALDLDGDPALGVTGAGALLPRLGDLAWGSDTGVNAPPALDAAPGIARQAEAAEVHYRRVHVNGARWAARVFGEGLGRIEPGAPADLILVDYHPATDLDRETLAIHLAGGAARAPVAGVMVAGEILMDNGHLVTVDEVEVAARARECARGMRKRIAAGPRA